MKSLVILVLLIIFVFVVIKYVKNNKSCPPPIIKFKNIPTTFNEQQYIQTPITYTYKNMFSSNSTWEDSVGFKDIPK
jgi:hypothetical protein